MSWIDVHTHLNMLERDADAVIQSARENKIDHLITIGTGRDDLEKVLHYVNAYKGVVYGTLGYHPHDAKDYNKEAEKFIRDHAGDAGIIGIGEIGLDYYYSHSEHDVQQASFRSQMQIAADMGLPVEIHTRDAEADTVAILSEFKGRVKGLMHCFTGSDWLADQALILGYNISVSGVVTFKNADSLRNTISKVPIDRLHIETDAPFLTPVPFRGKKNEPAFLIHTAKVVAELKKVSIEELAIITSQNARMLFTRMN